ncbi:methyltransferase [Actinomadura craniellae]|uniref:Methyltransferase n=1 Tax=Actinomadura craniellae TaxID=2231787 RepID=A0A365H7K1_9ACTN|nr:thiopeptide-type bacteriocin biosynthesis protein [Actinomadura craniellae]RAY14998.1 methyltransferase [Actinomadura craniellae]
MDGTEGWQQINIHFADWASAEGVAVTDLAPLLRQAQDDALLTGWFFVRKAPCWRLRYRPRTDPAQADDLLHGRLTRLATTRRITAFRHVVYEPELHAFGGPAGLATAHHLFHDDSRHLLTHLAHDRNGHRRELAVLLCCALLRGAGLDWYEQGDVWSRVADHRPPDQPLTAERRRTLEPALRRLLQVDTAPLTADGGPLAHTAEWPAAFTGAGEKLAALAGTGRLHRGLRAVLAHHVIFTWNRHGLPYPAQTALAHTAAQVVFGPNPTTEGATP